MCSLAKEVKWHLLEFSSLRPEIGHCIDLITVIRVRVKARENYLALS